ncbi:hypothetical protein ACFWF7_36195 [Nocardia sp. NPDC060256]|uniref:hypothetical protein n=1 Tax=unclassified Nocardia TaxID=2637762 RepID=UPI00365B50D7
MSEEPAVDDVRLRAFFQAQRDPDWRAWLAAMSEKLERLFGAMVGVDAQQWWTSAGLDHAESVALEIFPTPESWLLPQHMFVADQFHRYIGEVFRRAYGGRWVNKPRYDDADAVLGYAPVIDRPYDDEYFDPMALLNVALTLRTGTELSDRFRDEADYVEWCLAGRPELTAWFDVIEDARHDGP